MKKDADSAAVEAQETSVGEISIGDLQAADAKAETEARDITISEMKKMVDSLESELQNSISRENSLRRVGCDLDHLNIYPN